LVYLLVLLFPNSYTFPFTFPNPLLCRNPIHVSGVRRPSSGGTTLAVFGVSCNQPTAKRARTAHQKRLVSCLLKRDAWCPKHVEDYDTIKQSWKWKCIKLVTLLWYIMIHDQQHIRSQTVGDTQMSMEHWCNDTYKKEPSIEMNPLSLCHLVCHKTYKVWP
jgi:hypothetical protein